MRLSDIFRKKNILEPTYQAAKSDNVKKISAAIIPYAKYPKSYYLNDWKKAVAAATNPDNADFSLIQDIYENVMIDLHLSTLVESRTAPVKRSKFVLKNTKKEITEFGALLDKNWFEYFIELAIESRFYGYSILELNDFIDITKASVKLIERRNVNPRNELIYLEVGDTKGYNYTDGTLYPYYLPIYFTTNLGFLYKITPVVLAKKYAMSLWNEYNEKMVIPFRTIKTPARDKKRHQILGQILQEMGSAGWAVLNDDETLELTEISNANAYSAYDSLIERLENSITRFILGQTATTNQDNTGTYGSLQILNEVAQTRHETDRVFIRRLVNEELLPRLVLFGYINEGLSFEWDDSVEMTTPEKIDLINKLNQYYDVDANYVSKTTGIPLKEKKQIQPSINNSGERLIINHPKYQGTEKKKIILNESQDEAIKRIELKLVQSIYDGKAERFSPEYYQWLADTYFSKLSKNFDLKNENNFDHSLHASLEANIYRFSAAKNLALIQQMNVLLRGTANFNDFKQKTKPLLDNFNLYFMQTEYQTAISTSIGASRFWEMQNNADTLPFWEYQTTGDDRVREAHRKLNGMIFKANDTIWNTIYPPNGWNCRCEVIAHDEIPKGKKLNNQNDPIIKLQQTKVSKNKSEWDNMVAGRFNVNRSKTATAFNESNFYIKNLDKQNLGIRDFYGSDIYKWQNLDKSKLPELKPTYKNNQEAKNDLLSKLNQNKQIIYRDYQNRALNLTKKTINKHLNDKETYADRFKYAANISEVLKSPDEVWIEGNVGENSYTYVYIKFYNNEMITVYAEIKSGLPIRIKTFMGNKNDNNRKGILIKKMD